LLLRHRSPSSSSSRPSSSLVDEQSPHQKEINRIILDSRAHARHAVPVHGDDDDDDSDDDPGIKYWRRCQRWRWKTLCTKETLFNLFSKQSTPFFQQQCKTYSTSTFAKDLVAGCTVAITAVPLSMSYAKLAGLPAYYGLYASFLPPIVYPIFGSSRQLGVGPAALVSLLVSAGVSKIVKDEGLDENVNSDEYTARYTQLAIQCAFLAGIGNAGMGLLRFGFVTQFLSKALISGFTSGAAVIIACSQVKYLFGYNIPSSSRLQDVIKNLIQNIDDFNWKTFTMGSICILVLVTLKHVSQNKNLVQKYPNIKWSRALGPILVSVVAIVLVATLNLDENGIPVVGFIPSGLPSVTIDQWTPISSKLLVSFSNLEDFAPY
jgi:MFS superfamily sulfate permease-like transporter